MSRRPLALALLVLALPACRPGEPKTGAADTSRPAAAFRLAEHGGRTFDLAAERGNVVFLFFGYTHCPDVCPTTMVDFVGTRRALGPLAGQVRFVMVSVDPGRDTPEAIRNYVRSFDPDFYGLSTDSAATAELMRSYYVAAYRDPGGEGDAYTVTHSATVFVIDREGRIAERFGFGEGRSDAFAAAARRLLTAR